MRLSLFIILSFACIAGSCQTKSTAVEENNNYPIQKTDQEWKEMLTDEQFYILRKQGTERSFTGAYWDNKKKGIYYSAATGQPLVQLGAQIQIWHWMAKFLQTYK